MKHLKCVTKEISKKIVKKRGRIVNLWKKRILTKVRNSFWFHFYVKLEHWFVPFSVFVSVANLLWEHLWFVVCHILREIDFGKSKTSLIVIWTILEALNFDFCEILHVSRAKIVQNCNLENLAMIKLAAFKTLKL